MFKDEMIGDLERTPERCRRLVRRRTMKNLNASGLALVLLTLGTSCLLRSSHTWLRRQKT
jgi:hypothetical protein